MMALRPPVRVWTALTDAAKWFAGPPGKWELVVCHMVVRNGGGELVKARFRSGLIFTFQTLYLTCHRPVVAHLCSYDVSGRQ